MSQNNGRAKRSEKGLLTPDNCVVAFIDHQPQMLFGVSNFDRQSIINNVVALAKATRIFDLPVVLTTVESKSFSGSMWPQLRAVFPNREPIERSSMNSWDDRNFVAAIQKPARRRSYGPAYGPRPASRCPPFRRCTTATKSTSSKTVAEMLASCLMTTPCAGLYKRGRSR